MADIIDINVFQSVNSISFEVEPITNIVNINKITVSGGEGGIQDLQAVTDVGAYTSKNITANSFIKIGGNGNNLLLDNGNTIPTTSIVSTTNLTTSQTSTNFTINSDTGTDATIPLGNGTLAGATLNDYTTAEKNKLAAITGTNTGDQEIFWTKTGNDIKNNNTGNVEISATKTAISNLAQGAIVSNVLTSSANNDVLVGLDVKSIFNTGSYTGSTKYLFRISDDTILRSVISWHGSQKWWLNNGTTEAGSISYGTPSGVPGIIFLNATSTGRSDIRHISTGGIIIGSGTLGTIPPNQFWFYPTGNFAINQSTDSGYRLDVNGTTRLNGSVTATALVKYNSDLSSSYDDRTLVDKGYINNTFVPYTGATTDVNLGLNDITAEKLIKSGGTSSQILAADGSVITAGNNITITGGQISSDGGTGGGGSSVNYYLNGGTSQGTFGGSTYYEFSKTAVIGTGADFNINTNGYIASFITDVADPSLLLIPAGNWNLEFFFSSSSAGGTPSFYVELYKYDGTTFTSIASSSANPEGITGGTAIDAYFTPLAVPETVLTVNDRLAIRVFVNASSKTITLHTQNGHLCEVITTFTAGLTALNGLQAQVQNFATGTTGTDFAINSSGSTHTFNLPSASATARGVVTTTTQTFTGAKTFSSNPKIPINPGNSGAGGIVIDDGSGQIEVANNLIYPNTNELTFVKGVTSVIQTQLNSKAPLASPTFTGTVVLPSTTSIGTVSSTEIGYLDNVTSSIQTQLNGKQEALSSTVNIKSINGNSILGSGDLAISASPASQSAYTMLANNTNASAVPTEQPFENITNDVYSGTIVWTGGAAPTVPNHTYSLSQVGNLVTLNVLLSYGTSGGTSLTSVALELPSTAPSPTLPTSVSAVGDVINYGTAGLQIAKSYPTAPTYVGCAFRIKSTGVYEILITRAAGQYRYAYATIQYFV